MKHYLRILTFFLFASSLLTNCSFSGDPKIRELNRILEAGNNSVAAKRYDDAVKYYDQGLALEPGDALFLTNKSVALLRRGADRYNSAIRASDEKEKTNGKEMAGKDLQAAEATAAVAIDQLKSYHPIPLIDASIETTKISAYNVRAEALRIIAIALDHNRAKEALEAAHQYVEIEPGKEKKLMIRLDAGKMLIDTSNGNLAVSEYKNILDDYPDNIEALLGTGLALAQSGDKINEAKPYLRRFLELAPQNHPKISVAKEILDAPV